MVRILLRQLWRDDTGALISVEWVFVATILTLGSITGLVAVRQAVIAEMHDVANAMLQPGQNYSFSGQSNCASATGGGAQFADRGDSLVVHSTAATPGGADARACD